MNNWSDLAGDEGGGMGGGVGRWPMEGGQGGEMGGHQSSEQQKVHWFLGSLKNLTTGLIWLVTRVGGWGEVWGGGPWRAGKGEMGGGTREQCGSNKRCTGSPFWAPLKT